MLTRIWCINPVWISNQRPFCLGRRIVRAIDPFEIDLCQLMNIKAEHELGHYLEEKGKARPPGMPVSMQTRGFVVVDEAHRLNEKSGMYGANGENQIKEIVNSAKCTIFFVDEGQRVTLKDIGSKDQIVKFAKEKGVSVEKYTLS